MFPEIEITTNIFSTKICSRVNILSLKFATQKYSTKNRVCLIITCHKQQNTGLLFENMYFYCTYSIKMGILSMADTGYFLKITKINSQQEKPICPTRKN